MSNVVSLTKEELDQISDYQTKLSQLTLQRGQIGIAEDNIKRQLNQLAELFNELNDEEQKLSKELFDKYGRGEVDIKNGTFVKSEE